MTSRAEYQRGIMDAISDPNVERVALMTSAQIGKTEMLNNTVGFYISQDPAPILVLQPTLEMAETWSKDRLAPMLRDTPALRSLIADPRSRDSGNTLLHKRFTGGHVTVVGANSPSGLASRPIRVLLADEVDRYPVSAGTEGDPVSLAIKRTATFWNRKVVMVSTPTVKGQSRIEAAFAESDQRRFHVPCPDCARQQTLAWQQVRWPEGKPASAEYSCIECGSIWNDAQRWSAIHRGRWIAGAPFRGTVGFHLSELYSPWRKLGETATDFIESKADPERLKTWVNTALGETWEAKGETVDLDVIDGLREAYGPEDLPNRVTFATAGIDTQGDRLEVELVGWGRDEESWGIGYHVLMGDPAQQGVWDDLDALLLETYRNEAGSTIRVKAACIDSGGHHAEAVMRFARDRVRRKIYAIKGFGGAGKPIWPVRASRAKTKDLVYMVGVDTAKDTTYARLQIADPGPGFCHLPADPATGYDQSWVEMLTAEQKVTKYKEGRAYSAWYLPKGKRNEALDCRVYALAAMKSLPRVMREEEAALPIKAVEPREKWMGDRKGWF